MSHTIDTSSDHSINTPQASRVSEIALGPDGGSFSIVARDDANGSAQVSLLAGEVPRLIVALLHAAEALERRRGGSRPLVFPIEKGSVGLWEDDFVFRITLTESANMTFQLTRAEAASLFQALSTAFRRGAPSQTATH